MTPTNPEAVVAKEPTAAAVPDTHPKALWFIFWGEFAERSSYYGMRAILPLYMTTRLLMSDDQAAEWYSYFKSACYFLPLLGGFLADRYFGKYWTIVSFSIPYVIGQFLIGIEDKAVLISSLALLAMGSGVIKPNVSALLGQTYDQQRPGKERLRAAAFLWFYLSINIGSTISMLALPLVRDEFGYQKAFLIPAVFMALALAAFAAGKRWYAVELVGPRPPATPEERQRRWQVLTSLFGVFALIVFFWVVYEHNDNLWVFFARDHMDRRLPGWLGGKVVPPDGFQFINAVLVVTMIPFLQWFWPRVDPTGRRFPPTTKMLLGFLFTAAAAATMTAAAQAAGGGSQVSMGWVVLAYFMLTAGEVLVYGTGLDLSYSYAPADMKGFVTACFLLTNAIANIINSRFAPLYGTTLSPATFFAVDVGLALSAAVVFYFVGRKFRAIAQQAARGYGAARYFLSRFQTLRVWRLPSLLVKSAGRSLPGAAKQNFTVSPSSS